MLSRGVLQQRGRLAACGRLLSAGGTSKGTAPKVDATAASGRLSKELWTVPNMITVGRMLASPGLGLAIAYDMKEVALIGCALAGFSDWLDGYIAKNYNQMTVLGGMLDPIADKVMIGCLTAGLAFKGLMPVELVGVIIGRDMALIIASFAIRGYEKPKDAPFFDTTYSATFEIVPSTLSKVNTGLQFVLVGSTLGSFYCNVPDVALLQPLWWLTGGTTLLSGADYLTGSGVRRISARGVGRGLDDEKYKS